MFFLGKSSTTEWKRQAAKKSTEMVLALGGGLVIIVLNLDAQGLDSYFGNSGFVQGQY